MEVFLIFPNQLYFNLTHLKNSVIVYLIEEPRFFCDFKFHKLKLAYHRATMKKYHDYLKNKKINIKYIEFNNATNNFYKEIYKNNSLIKIISVADHKLENKLVELFKNKLVIMDNKNFLISINELDDIKKIIYKNNKYYHDIFYKYQRKKLNILMKNDKPIGDKWSYDSENRLALPKNFKDSNVNIKKILKNKYTIESIKYVNKNFEKNYGSLDYFIYPIDTKNTKVWLKKFLETKLINFGKYQDAVIESEPFLYHSILSPMMNIGLITDTEVVKISYDYYKKHSHIINIESFEGFIRQVIGWRNYVYTIYMLEGPKLYEMNYLKHHNSLNDKFWTANTNINPIDSIINKIINYSYAHHIERLMYLGNFMLLCFIDPKEVHKIFMEWTIDAYDWVMVPNIMGMSQFSDGGMMMTRPYFSSSNYINRMSNYKKGDWVKIWDALYYNFIDKHQNILKKNYAISNQVNNWIKKSNEEKEEIKHITKKFLNELL
jgi:deoxyribodipyrimidine photolyase-related protein|uniref:Cryptochrome/DNA photolyase FAD-binding domain-containing protein n=1 Tax=viral metagenome TaxID=1070528 RepID=A0A6C0EDJ3_9ZZZZ